MTSKQIVRLFPKRKLIHKQIHVLNKEITKLERQRNKLLEQCKWLDRVEEIYKGVPLVYARDSPNRMRIYSFGNDKNAYAHIYPNANFPNMLCLIVGSVQEHTESFRGSEWPSLKTVLTAAKDWIALGKLPTPNGERSV